MRNKSHGFSLIELMITVAIVAILAAIAYPSYQNQIRKSNRAVAKTALMTYAQFLEKCYTENSRYTGCTYAPTDSATFDGGKRLFAIGIANPNAQLFTITATAQNFQASDGNCAVFSLDNANRKSATTSGGIVNSNVCWQ
jgi:type IV pilus assembly protein PilE